uniref:Tps1 n=1 Tax=Arundo donax TaxID=35708 RepID=A0A0A9B336_ARUDO
MLSRTNSSSEILTLEALCNSNKVLVSFKYPSSELWKPRASAT